MLVGLVMDIPATTTTTSTSVASSSSTSTTISSSIITTIYSIKQGSRLSHCVGISIVVVDVDNGLSCLLMLDEKATFEGMNGWDHGRQNKGRNHQCHQYRHWWEHIVLFFSVSFLQNQTKLPLKEVEWSGVEWSEVKWSEKRQFFNALLTSLKSEDQGQDQVNSMYCQLSAVWVINGVVMVGARAVELTWW